MESLIDQLKKWISEGKFFSWDHVYIYHEVNNPDHLERELKFSISTKNNEYVIRAIERESGKNYLGCIADSRVRLPGEHHTRGNDLADGDFTRETWIAIMADIISYELVEAPKKQEPIKIECEETCTLGGEE